MAQKEEKKGLVAKLSTAFDMLGKARQALKEFAEQVEESLKERARRLKRGLTQYLLMLFFLFAGVLAVLWGAVIYLAKFLSLEFIFLLVGLVCLGVALYLARK